MSNVKNYICIYIYRSIWRLHSGMRQCVYSDSDELTFEPNSVKALSRKVIACTNCSLVNGRPGTRRSATFLPAGYNPAAPPQPCPPEFVNVVAPRNKIAKNGMIKAKKPGTTRTQNIRSDFAQRCHISVRGNVCHTNKCITNDHILLYSQEWTFRIDKVRITLLNMLHCVYKIYYKWL